MGEKTFNRKGREGRKGIQKQQWFWLVIASAM